MESELKKVEEVQGVPKRHRQDIEERFEQARASALRFEASRREAHAPHLSHGFLERLKNIGV